MAGALPAAGTPGTAVGKARPMRAEQQDHGGERGLDREHRGELQRAAHGGQRGQREHGAAGGQ